MQKIVDSRNAVLIHIIKHDPPIFYTQYTECNILNRHQYLIEITLNIIY